jgi:hypothetical protein
MTIGETMLTIKIPNLNKILFNGVKIFEFISPKIKKNIAIIKDQILTFSSLNKGNTDTIKKNKKKLFQNFYLFQF